MKALDLRGRRNSLGVRIEPLADAVGIHNNTLTDIERGRIGIDVETYQEILSAAERLAADPTQEEVVAA